MREVVINEVREEYATRISRQMVESLTMRAYRDLVTQDLVAGLECKVLSETLPPQRIISDVTFSTPRFATWRDHFRATYRWRWWGRLLRLREPQFIDEPLSHVTQVDVAQRWTYPSADLVLPGREFGTPVLKTMTTWNASRRWW